MSAGSLDGYYSTIGVAHIAGDYTLEHDGTLEVDVSGDLDEPGRHYDIYQIDGSASLLGTLRVSFIRDYVAALGDSFEFLTAAGGVDGGFDSLDLPALSTGLQWRLTSTATAMFLNVVSTAIPGDFNRDGVVDSADYTVWRDSLGTITLNTRADGDGNGVVDQNDYNIWKSHYGERVGGGASNGSGAASEPSSWLLLLTAAIPILSRRRQRSESR
jgi:hypothetical protein